MSNRVSIILLKYLLLCSFHVMAKDSLLRSHDHPNRNRYKYLVTLARSWNTPKTHRHVKTLTENAQNTTGKIGFVQIPGRLQHTPISHTPGHHPCQLWKDSLYSLLLKVYVGVCCSSVCWWPTLDKSFQPLPFSIPWAPQLPSDFVAFQFGRVQQRLIFQELLLSFRRPFHLLGWNRVPWWENWAFNGQEVRKGPSIPPFLLKNIG